MLGGTLAYGGTAQGAVNAGSHTLSASGLTSGTYDISYAAGGLTVARRSVTVTADDETRGVVIRGEVQSPFQWSFAGGGALASPYLFAAAGLVHIEEPTAVESSVTRAGAYGLGVRPDR